MRVLARILLMAGFERIGAKVKLAALDVDDKRRMMVNANRSLHAELAAMGFDSGGELRFALLIHVCHIVSEIRQERGGILPGFPLLPSSVSSSQVRRGGLVLDGSDRTPRSSFPSVAISLSYRRHADAANPTG